MRGLPFGEVLTMSDPRPHIPTRPFARLLALAALGAGLGGCALLVEFDDFAFDAGAAATCGNGTTEGLEQCDDGNGVNTDACTNTCAAAICADGIIHLGVEECDDGNGIDTDACTDTCTDAVCGDGILYLGVEECDDGNTDDSDGCHNDCTLGACDGPCPSIEEVDLTPSTGSSTSRTVSRAVMGYRFTATQTFSITRLDWWIDLPSSASIAARIYDDAGTEVATGSVATGANQEQWYGSTVAYTFESGSRYTVAMYHSDLGAGSFDAKENPTQGYTLAPFVSEVESRSTAGTWGGGDFGDADEYPAFDSAIAPYQKMVVTTP